MSSEIADNRSQTTAPAQPQSDYRARALEAAFTEAEDRAWARVRLAADLRADGEGEAALRVLDDAWRLEPTEDVTCAIFAVAIAVHCDLGTHPTAEVIEREHADRFVDEEFARAAARLYVELTQMTGDRSHRRRRDCYSAMIAEHEERRSLAA